MIKYTKNMPTKLLNMGFKFYEECKEEGHSFQVFTHGPIDVVVDDKNKEIVVEFASWELNVPSLLVLQILVNTVK